MTLTHPSSQSSSQLLARLSPGAADALLFDIGRVVINIDFGKALACWAGHAGCTASDLAARFVPDESYRHHETGRLSDAEYFGALRTSLGIDIADDQFLQGWNAIFAGEMPDIENQLARAAKHLPLYAFSNTNRPHVEYFSIAYADVLRHFREVFVSSSIGLRKPDAAAYDHVVKAIGVPASRIVFFDDVAENIEGARAVGIHAVLVKSPADISETLSALGI